MSTRKTSLFYAVLIAIASLAVGMVIASRLDLTPASSAQMVAMPRDEQHAARRPDRCHHVPEYRQDADSDRRQHPHRVAPAHAGSDRVLRRAAAATTCCAGSSAARQPDRPTRPGSAARGVRRRRASSPRAPAPGFVIDKAGYILTNNHVDRRRRQDHGLVRRRGAQRGVRGQGRRPRPADRQRAPPADRDAVDSRSRKRSSATRRRCSRATGSWRSATRSVSATPSRSA